MVVREFLELWEHSSSLPLLLVLWVRAVQHWSDSVGAFMRQPIYHARAARNIHINIIGRHVLIRQIRYRTVKRLRSD